MNVLMIDDDIDLGGAIQPMLQRYGINLTHMPTPNLGLQVLRDQRPDIVLLDMMMPEMDGMEVYHEISAAPEVYGSPHIVVLSARVGLTDRIVCLEAGVDDYITKPFDLRELVARLRAIMRGQARQNRTSLPQLEERLDLDPARLEVVSNGVRVAVTALEMQLLQQLYDAEGRILGRAELLRGIGYDDDSDPTVVDTLVYRIRQRFRAEGTATEMIQTVRNQGYRIQHGGLR